MSDKRKRWQDQAGSGWYPTKSRSEGPVMWPVPDCPHKAEAEKKRRGRR